MPEQYLPLQIKIPHGVKKEWVCGTIYKTAVYSTNIYVFVSLSVSLLDSSWEDGHY